jgi:hypothetical protein
VESFNSPSVHPAESLADAMDMFDSHVPLTHREKKLILQSLYDQAFCDGARQGRQAGVEAVHAEIRTMASDYRGRNQIVASRDDIANLLESLLPADEPREYMDPTQAIRDELTKKATQRNNGL